MSSPHYGQPRLAAITQLKERNGAARHDDERVLSITKAAVEAIVAPMEQRHREELAEIRRLAETMNAGYAKLANVIEAFTIGSDDVAVAGLVDGESTELPNFNRYKAEATVLYKLKASDIAEKLGVKKGVVVYLLCENGLNWIIRKPKLWNAAFYQMTKRRLWHVDLVKLLREVALTADHPERENISKRCDQQLGCVRYALEKQAADQLGLD